MQEQVRIAYQYRDAGNNKNYAEVVLDNPSSIDVERVKLLLRATFEKDQCFADILHFKPEKLGIPTQYFDSYEPDLDLPLHEVIEIVPTDEAATLQLTIDDLLHRLQLIDNEKLAEREHWKRVISTK